MLPFDTPLFGILWRTSPTAYQPDARIREADRHADHDLDDASPVVARLYDPLLVRHQPDVHDHVQNRWERDDRTEDDRPHPDPGGQVDRLGRWRDVHPRC